MGELALLAQDNATLNSTNELRAYICVVCVAAKQIVPDGVGRRAFFVSLLELTKILVEDWRVTPDEVGDAKIRSRRATQGEGSGHAG
jgi:hypothetical protein